MSKKPKTPEAEKFAYMTAYTERIKDARDYIADCMLCAVERAQALKDAKECLAKAQQQLLDEIDDDEPRLPFAEDAAASGSGGNGREKT